jgi:Fe2+ transport system protein FeoA
MSDSPDRPNLPTMPLTACRAGQRVSFAGLRHGGAGLSHRLAEMGLVPGVEMEVVNPGPGPFIVCVRGSRLLLGRGMVNKILVRPA